MAAPPDKFDFLIDGMEVGYFEEIDPPTSPGRYRYMPYRGPGHAQMHSMLHAGQRPRCNYVRDGLHHSFAVVRCPDHGMLELADFDIT